MFDEVRPKVLCIHTKPIIVCRRVQAVKKRQRLLVVYILAVFASRARTVQMFDFARFNISQLDNFRKQSNYVRTMLRSALLVIGHVLTVDFIGLVEKMVDGIQKTTALIAGAPFPFPLFRAFLPPPPFFAPAMRAIQPDQSLTTSFWVTDFAFDFKRTQLLILGIPWYSFLRLPRRLYNRISR